jgi:tRNA-dihydrouridine synthase 1
MLMPDKLLNEREYLEQHLKDLTSPTGDLGHPVVVQLCGNNVETIVQAGKKLQNYCQGIGIFLGSALRVVLIVLPST